MPFRNDSSAVRAFAFRLAALPTLASMVANAQAQFEVQPVPEQPAPADMTGPIIIGVAAVLILGAIVYYIISNKGGASKPPATTSRATTTSKVDEDEGTQVRVAGHRLIRMHGGVKVGAEVPIVSSLTIGRDKTCNLSLSDPEMSSLHAEIVVDARGAVAFDRGSTNGTMVNDQPVGTQGVLLQDGDTVRVGGTSLLYKSA